MALRERVAMLTMPWSSRKMLRLKLYRDYHDEVEVEAGLYEHQ